jgi:hypothetical protein
MLVMRCVSTLAGEVVGFMIVVCCLLNVNILVARFDVPPISIKCVIFSK